MGLMDKMKAAAQDVATQAKSATAQAQTKIEQSQTRKKMDDFNLTSIDDVVRELMVQRKVSLDDLVRASEK
mgnify:CR=1 FL=1